MIEKVYKNFIEEFITSGNAFGEEKMLANAQSLHSLVDNAVAEDPKYLYSY